MTMESTQSEQTGTQRTRVYLVYRDDELFRCSLDVQKMCDCLEYYTDKDIEEKYTWSLTSKELD